MIKLKLGFYIIIKENLEISFQVLVIIISQSSEERIIHVS